LVTEETGRAFVKMLMNAKKIVILVKKIKFVSIPKVDIAVLVNEVLE